MDPRDEDYWKRANELLAQRSQPQQAAPQQSTWAEANDLLTRMNAQNPVRQRTPIADEPAPQRDDKQTYLGMLMSLIGNKGRNLGDVIEAGNNSFNQRLASWEARNSPDAKLDREMKQQQLARMERDNNGVNFGQAAQLAGILGNERQQNTQAQQYAAREEQDARQAQANALVAQATQQELNARDEAGRRTQLQVANIAQQGANARDQAGIAANTARDEAKFAHDIDMKNRDIAADNARKQLELQVKQRPPITGASIIDNDRWQSLHMTEQNKATEQMIAGRKINNDTSELLGLYFQPYSTANETQFKQIQFRLLGALSKPNETGTLQNPEFLRAIQNLPEYGSTSDMISRARMAGKSGRALLEVIGEQNPSVQALQQIQKSFATNSQIINEGYGLRDDRLTPFSLPEMKPQQTAAEQPNYDEIMGSLKGTVQPLNPEPAQPAQGGGLFDAFAARTPSPAINAVRAQPPRAVAAPVPTSDLIEFAPQNMTPAVRGAMPQSRPNTLPQPAQSNVPMQGGQQLQPLIDPRTGQMSQPMSIQEMQRKIAQGWRVAGNG